MPNKNIRVSDNEDAEFNRTMAELQEIYGDTLNVTYRTVAIQGFIWLRLALVEHGPEKYPLAFNAARQALAELGLEPKRTAQDATAEVEDTSTDATTE